MCFHKHLSIWTTPVENALLVGKSHRIATNSEKSQELTVMSSSYPRLCTLDVLTLCSHQEHPPYFINPHNCPEKCLIFQPLAAFAGACFSKGMYLSSLLLCLPPSLLPWLHKEIHCSYDTENTLLPELPVLSWVLACWENKRGIKTLED